jgi:hypothetical protein
MHPYCGVYLLFEGWDGEVSLGHYEEVMKGVVFGFNCESLAVELGKVSRDGPVKFGHGVGIICG